MATKDGLSPAERKRRRERNTKLDSILRKINRRGMDKLTVGERSFLEAASEELAGELEFTSAEPDGSSRKKCWPEEMPGSKLAWLDD